ncbi:MAG: GNAT family N-acetyltransferase [Chloroflexi bacterium]|nr:GNAT family N-acetyltransferase [Chloroflexota bacterium]
MRGSEPPDPMITRMHENFAESYRVIGRTVAGGAVFESEGATAVATGVDRAEFNRLFVFSRPADPELLLDRASAFFGDLGLPWCVVAASGVAGAFANASGLEAGPDLPGMLLAPLVAAAEEESSPLRIERVEAGEPAARFIEIMASGFSTPRELFAVFADPALLAQPGLTHYLGYCGGRAVATATLLCSHGIAGVSNVSTLHSFRRRGYGAAMTRHAAEEGRAAGCTASALQATRAGYSLYKELGFRHVTDYRCWFPVESR